MFENIYDDESKIVSRVNYKKALVLTAFYSYKTKTLTGNAKSFTGIKTMLLLKCNNNQKFYLNFNVNSGKAKLVAINKQKQITLLAENNFLGQINTKFIKGFYRIRLVGENCDVNFNLKKIKE